MKKVYSQMLFAASVSLVSVSICRAQAPSTTLALKAPAGAVTIDGNGREWGDSLSYYNASNKIHYNLSNDKDNLYLVVKTKNPEQEECILATGIKFAIDTKGRKKSAYTVEFPYSENSATIIRGGQSPEEKSIKAGFAKFRKIDVRGFKDISDDQIDYTNTYGIKVAMDYDDKGYLVYEEAIPLALFHAADLMNNEWSYNIRINGIDAPDNNNAPAMPDAAASGGRGGRGGGGGGGGKSGDRKGGGIPGAEFSSPSKSISEVNFWGKFSLAK